MRTKIHNDWHSEARRDTLCRRYAEAARAWWVSAEDYAAAHGIDGGLFCKWLRQRGIRPSDDPTNMGNRGPRPQYWRHGGLCTPRADANGIGMDDD